MLRHLSRESRNTEPLYMPPARVSSPHIHTEMQHEDISDMDFDDYAARRHSLDESEEDYITEDDLLLPDPAPSGRSSISSFPASIVHHNITPSQTFPQHGLHTPSRSRAGTPTAHTPSAKPASPMSARERVTGFRNPSSVRALQMRDEFSDGEDLTPGHRRRDSRMSLMSYRSGSTHSTPGKRISRSLQSSPVKGMSRLRKEFPLVLLHCTILPSLISPKAVSVSSELLEAIVPEPYKRRWKLLNEKVMRNIEVRDRGVLISHPRDDYELLEERLLESLELDEPVVSHGHFVNRSESRASTTDSGFASEENSNRGDATDEDNDEAKCADCGGLVCGDSRWDVKVYAANGLMRAGAWGAVWSDMEKVDVQVSVRLPEGVRQEIDTRLDAVLAQEQQLQAELASGTQAPDDDERTREIYGESAKPKTQEEIDGLNAEDDNRPEHSERRSTGRKEAQMPVVHHSGPEKIDLQDALFNYVRLLLQDQRNIAILLLSILLISYGVNSRQTLDMDEAEYIQSSVNTKEVQVEYLTTTVFSTSTAIALETSTVTETVRSLESVVTSTTGHASTNEAQTVVAVASEMTTAPTASVETEARAFLFSPILSSEASSSISLEPQTTVDSETSPDEHKEIIATAISSVFATLLAPGETSVLANDNATSLPTEQEQSAKDEL